MDCRRAIDDPDLWLEERPNVQNLERFGRVSDRRQPALVIAATAQSVLDSASAAMLVVLLKDIVTDE